MTDRHPSVDAITRFFEYDHLPEPLRAIAGLAAEYAQEMLYRLGDDPELTVGLRKLLEAKDCFVRAAVAQENYRNNNPNEGAPLSRD